MGTWVLQPRGLELCGNSRAPPAPEAKGVNEILESLETGTPVYETSYEERLSSKCDSKQVITGEEVARFLQLSKQGDDVWEMVVAEEKIQVRRHRNRQLFRGSLFVRLTARLANTTCAHVAHCMVNFQDRAQWDKQLDNFRILHTVAGNDVLHCILHAPPLRDRDFVLFFTVWRKVDGKGILLYSRFADDALSPPTRAVRAIQYVQATTILEDGTGGVSIETLTAIDPIIPFMPQWIVSWLVPSEFRRWVRSVERRCAELRRDSAAVPCAALCTAGRAALKEAAEVAQAFEVLEALEAPLAAEAAAGEAEPAPASELSFSAALPWWSAKGATLARSLPVVLIVSLLFFSQRSKCLAGVLRTSRGAFMGT